MHTGSRVISADLLQRGGTITSAHGGYVVVRWDDGPLDEYTDAQAAEMLMMEGDGE